MDLGISTYINGSVSQSLALVQKYKINYIFTSLHINELLTSDFLKKAQEHLKYLSKTKAKIIVDISPVGLKALGITYNKIPNWFKNAISYVRLDYGFTIKEMVSIGNQMNICLNASTMKANDIWNIANRINYKVQPFHNFYPKVFSGLDVKFFKTKNLQIKKYGLTIWSFIVGKKFRGPIFKGLPTLEIHRNKSTLYSFLDSSLNFGVDVCFMGDETNEVNVLNILKIVNKNILPLQLKHSLPNKYKGVITLRPDKSSYIARVVESRKQMVNHADISSKGLSILKAGDISIDNNINKRYVGEIQFILKDIKLNSANKISELLDKSLVEFINDFNKIET